MGYLKKNVNLFLLVLIVATLATLVGLTTYYQNTYQNLSTDFEKKSEELAILSQNLTFNKFQLNQTFSELQVKEQDTEKFNELYSEVTAERDKLNIDLEATRVELTSTLADLKKAIAELDTAKANLNIANTEIDDLQNRVNNLEDESANLDDQVDNYENEICSLDPVRADALGISC